MFSRGLEVCQRLIVCPLGRWVYVPIACLLLLGSTCRSSHSCLRRMLMRRTRLFQPHVRPRTL